MRMTSSRFVSPSESNACPIASSRAPRDVPLKGASKATTAKSDRSFLSSRSEIRRPNIASLALPSIPSFHSGWSSSAALAAVRLGSARIPSNAVCSLVGRSSATVTRLPLVSASQTRLRKEAGASFDPCNSPTNTQRTDFLLHIWSAPGMAEHEANATAELIANPAPHPNPTNRLMELSIKGEYSRDSR